MDTQDTDIEFLDIDWKILSPKYGLHIPIIIVIHSTHLSLSIYPFLYLFIPISIYLTMDIADLPNLASPQLGAAIVFATDEWFAAAGETYR